MKIGGLIGELSCYGKVKVQLTILIIPDKTVASWCISEVNAQNKGSWKQDLFLNVIPGFTTWNTGAQQWSLRIGGTSFSSGSIDYTCTHDPFITFITQ